MHLKGFYQREIQMKNIVLIVVFMVGVVSYVVVTGQEITIAAQAVSQTDQYWSQAETLKKEKKYSEAAQLYIKSAEAEQANPQPELTKVADALHQAGECYREIEQNDTAIDFYEQSIEIDRQLDRQTNIAKNFMKIATIYVVWGQYNEALNLYEQSLNIFRQGGDEANAAQTVTGMGRAYRKQGNYDKALAFYGQALQFYIAEDNQGDIASTLNRIAVVYWYKGKYDEALDYYEQALTINRQLDRKIKIAQNLNNIGLVYIGWGKYDKAIDYYEQALELNRQEERGRGVAINFSNIGEAYYEWHQYDKALEYYEQALEKNRQIGRQSGFIENLINIGNVYRKKDQSDQAVNYYEQALELARQTEDQSHMAAALNNIGKVYFKGQDYDKALNMYQQALEFARQMGENPSSADALTNIGKVYKAQGTYPEAISHLAEAVAIKEELRQTATGDVRRDYLASQIETYQILTSCYVLFGDFVNAFQTIELTRAKLLLEQLAGHGITEVEPPSLEHIQSYLPQDAAILIYADIGTEEMVQIIITKEQIIALERSKTEFTEPVMKRDGSKITYVLEDGDEPQDDDFSRILRYYRKLMREVWPVEAVSRNLYSFLISEFQEQFSGKTKLIIVPDGMLNFLPFETLKSDEGKYLAESYQITYAQSLGVLDLLRQRDYSEFDRQPLLAFGGAVYEKPEEKIEKFQNEAQLKYVRKQVDEAITRGTSLRKIYASSLGIWWSDLPGSFDEVTTIQKIVAGSEIMTGEQVNETTVKAQSTEGTLANYKILHFAAHGMVELTIPELSALILSQFQSVGKGETEDNYLRVGEVADLKLQADFVNLSACQTGLGKVYGGQGVVGLTQSFLLAGTNGLSVSLWSVSDEATAQFMITLYELIAEGMDYPDAIAEVKRRFISGEFGEEWQHPYYWSPFVYYGRGSDLHHAAEE